MNQLDGCLDCITLLQQKIEAYRQYVNAVDKIVGQAKELTNDIEQNEAHAD